MNKAKASRQNLTVAHRAGFTFVEMLLAVIVISLLSGAALVLTSNSKEGAGLSVMQADLRHYALSQEQSLENSGYYAAHPDSLSNFSLSDNVILLSSASAENTWSVSVGHKHSKKQCSITSGELKSNSTTKIVCSALDLSFSMSETALQSGDSLYVDAGLAIAELVWSTPGFVTPLYAADPEDIEEVRWDFGDGTIKAGSPYDFTNAAHLYELSDTTLYIRLKLTTKDGKEAYGIRTLYIKPTLNLAPKAQIEVDTPAGLLGSTISFSAIGSSDPEKETLAFYWDFGDGSTATGSMVEHSYQSEGTYTVRLTAMDPQGATDAAFENIEVYSNLPPDPSLSYSPSAPQQYEPVSFDASASSDPEGGPLSYEWEFGDVSSNTGALVEHTFSRGGKFIVSLTVVDDMGQRSTTQQTVNVTSNLSPIAVMEVPDSVILGASSSVSSQGSYDPDGTIQKISWDMGDGSAEQTGESVSHSYQKTGVFPVTLTVTDDKSSSTRAEKNIVVKSANAAPTASFTISTNPAKVETVVTFDASSSSDGDGSIASYTWDLGDGSTANTPVVAHTYHESDTLVVTLSVEDDRGAAGTSSREIIIVPNHTPVASFVVSPDSGYVYEDILFDASSSYDPDGSIASYDWEFGDWGIGTGETITRSFTTPSSFMVRLEVTDESGARAATERSLSIKAEPNQDPVAAFSITKDPVQPGEPTTLYALASYDPENDALSYAWDFGDGNTAGGVIHSHSYSSTGTYTVNLVVTDDAGGTSTTSKTVVVEDLTPPALDSYLEILWPANNRYNEIGIRSTIEDSYDPYPVVYALVESSEIDDGTGDGATDGDIKVTHADGSVSYSSQESPAVQFDPRYDKLELRAERSGQARGRVYTITIVAHDSSNNSINQKLSILVPHDLKE